jgi:acetyl-CoA synthetase
VLGFPHDIKGNAVWFCNSKRNGEYRDRENLSKEINQHISDHIGPAKLDKIQFVPVYQNPFCKIMRRILRKIAEEITLILEILQPC